jgi:hypothetical protein
LSPALTISIESFKPCASSSTRRGNRYGKDLGMRYSSSSTSLLDAPVHRSSSINQDVTSTYRFWFRVSPVLALQINDLVAAAAPPGSATVSAEGSRGRRPAGALGLARCQGDRGRAWDTVGGKTESPRSERVSKFARSKVASKSESKLISFRFPN